jgi:putative phosphoribosyl transferase
MGAVAEGGKVFLSQEIVELSGVTNAELMEVVRRESAEVAHRIRRFRGDRPPPELEGRMVILVDDGIATGGTVRAAIRALRRRRPKAIVLAVPVAAADTVAELRPEVDDLVCLLTPRQLFAIGGWYEDFGQVEDSEVTALLERARHALSEAEAAGAPAESRPVA